MSFVALVFSQNSVPAPDYKNGTVLLFWQENVLTSPSGILSKYAYTGMQDTKKDIWTISDSQCFTIPKDGYIVAESSVYYSKKWSDSKKPYQSLFVNLQPVNSGWRHVFLATYSEDIGALSYSSYIPVNKGDKVAVGVQSAGDILPTWCSVAYYPIKLKDASSI